MLARPLPFGAAAQLQLHSTGHPMPSSSSALEQALDGEVVGAGAG